MAGKPTMTEPTREAQRLLWLIAQFEKIGVSQAEFCRRTGIHPPHLNAIRKMDSERPRGIGAAIVRKVRDGVKIDPAYFFDDYEGEKPHELYLLSAKRDEKRVQAIETGLASEQRRVANHDVELAQLREQVVSLGQDLAKTRAELREVLGAMGAAKRQAQVRQRKASSGG